MHHQTAIVITFLKILSGISKNGYLRITHNYENPRNAWHILFSILSNGMKLLEQCPIISDRNVTP